MILEKAKKIASIPKRPSFFALEYMLVGKEETHQAKLFRITEEIRSKISEVDSIDNQIEDTQDSIKLMEIDYKKIEDTEEGIIQKRMITRRIKGKIKENERMNQTKKARIEEIEFLTNLYEKLVKIEPQKNWDDYNVQLEYFDAKIGKEISMRTMLNSGPCLELLKSALALPNESNIKKYLISATKKEMLENANK